MKFILSLTLIVGGLFIWAMMQYTSLGYNGWGIFVTIAALLAGIYVATDRS